MKSPLCHVSGAVGRSAEAKKSKQGGALVDDVGVDIIEAMLG